MTRSITPISSFILTILREVSGKIRWLSFVCYLCHFHLINKKRLQLYSDWEEGRTTTTSRFVIWETHYFHLLRFGRSLCWLSRGGGFGDVLDSFCGPSFALIQLRTHHYFGAFPIRFSSPVPPPRHRCPSTRVPAHQETSTRRTGQSNVTVGLTKVVCRQEG